MSLELTEGAFQKFGALAPVGVEVGGPPPLKVVMKKDTRLPFVEFAWSRQKMLEFVNREVLPTGSVAKAVAVTIERTAYTAGRRCVVLLSIHFSDQLRPPRKAVVSFARDDGLEEVYMRHYRHGADWDLAAPVVYLPRYRCLVEFFPLDWQLPWLGWAMDPRSIAPLLGKGVEPGRSNSGPQPEAEVLRYRPHETCVLAYRVLRADADLPEEAVGKLYGKEDRAPHVWCVLNALQSQAADYGVGVPRPLAIERERRLVLMERLPGAAMKNLLKGATSEGQLRAAVRTAATALAAFHRLRFEGNEFRCFAGDMEKLRKRAARLRLVAPLLYHEVVGIQRKLQSQGALCTVGASTLIHGDFKPGQVLTEAGRGNVVDFDKTCRGDPAIDLGSFMAQLRKKAVTSGQGRWRYLSSSFLAEYQERSRTSGLDHRARVFEVLSLARMAVRKFERSPQSYARKGDSSDQVLLLKEAASCLAEL